MKAKIRVYEVSREVIREDDKERIIFEFRDGKNVDGDVVEKPYWIYHAPNAQDHTEKQLEIILVELKKLNENNR